jgi:prepilin-type N-terminal cleavage/methylation domain-containing protein
MYLENSNKVFPMKKIREYIQSLPSFSNAAGFTMIELLVVIAVIGILAVAVLSSINPIEQINKGRDTRVRSDAAQLLNASDRYFAIHEVYPWNTTTGTYTSADITYDSEFVFDGPGGDDWNYVDVLVTTAEVKEGYVNRLKNDSRLIVFKEDVSNATAYTCFVPTSEAFKFEAANNCADGTTPGGAGSSVTPPAGITPCTTTDGTIDDANMICLP